MQMRMSQPAMGRSAVQGRTAVRPFQPATRGHVRCRVQMPGGMQDAMQKMMQDPQMQERMAAMQEAMKRPEMQQQMQQMMAMAQNQQMQQRMAALKEDPEMAPIFEEIQKGGMAALMKYYNDPAFLAKLGEKMGDVAPEAAAAASAPAGAVPGAAPPVPEITTLLEAARYGDLEAVEDFLAIGKDVNMADEQQRSPLHYAAAYDHAQVAQALLDAGAKLEAVDSKSNTPLHYAAGYGRGELVVLLLEKGANKGAKNETGKTPAELATMDPRNPVGQDEGLMMALTP